MSDEMHQSSNTFKNISKESPENHRASRTPSQQSHNEANLPHHIFSQSTEAIMTSTSATSPPVSLASSESNKKWNCEYCTYENFPLSLKCTMCRCPKPLMNEDIFRLHEAEETSSVCGAAARENVVSHKPSETNSPSTTNISRHSEGKHSSIESIQEPMSFLSVSKDVDFPSISDTSHCTNSKKWTCQMCTFENWPKSIKCAMCATQRSAVQVTSPQRTSSQERDHIISYDTATDTKNNSKHSSRSPFGINDICGPKSPVHEMEATNNRRIKRHRQTDWAWLQACLGVVDGDIVPVEKYLATGGDPKRQLTASEVSLLNRTSAFDAGYTLIHLAIRFKREDILSSLLSRISGGGSGIKRAPSFVAPDLASAIRRHVASIIRHKKGFPCRYLYDITTFCLPADVEELPQNIQDQLFDELLDRDAQQQLEGDAAVINWSLELTVRLGSRLFALWNRSAGDCLLDAVLQATWGVFDRDNTLRRALADTLHHAGRAFYSRWRSHEILEATRIGYVPDERQLETDWARALHAAAQPGRSLAHLHVWALAHVVRRPILVYAVDIVNSFRGEALGYACFQGVYLPLMWEHTFCSKSPICLGYTRGHFSALVPVEPYSHTGNTAGYICRSENGREEEEEEEDDGQDEIFLPLTDSEGKLLPVHFLTCEELGHEETILQQWMMTCSTEGGVLVARQRTRHRPLLVAQMLEEWLNHYRRIAQQTAGPFPPRLSTQVHEFSSDGETDEE